MTGPFTSTAIAILVAFGFAALAEALLGRRSRGLLLWNESFVIGAGMAAALLFPLSLLFPRGALGAVLLVLIAAALIRSVAALARKAGSPSTPPPSRDLLSASLVAAILLPALVFLVIDLRTPFAWDGFQIWATKGFLLFRDHALKPEMWPGSVNEGRSGRTVSYPSLVPLFEALLWRIRGGFDFLAVKPIFAVFFVSILLSSYRASRAIGSRREALAATLLLALLPAWTSRENAGGYADLPEAACVAALAAAWLAGGPGRLPEERTGRWNSPVPWLLGSLLMVKSEGSILFVAAGLAGVIVAVRPVMFDDLKAILPRIRGYAGGLTVAAALLAGRIWYLRWTDIPDKTYGPVNAANCVRALHRLGLVTRLCWRELGDLSRWGFFWPAFLLAALAALGWGRERERALALASVIALSAYSAIFLFTNWPVKMEVQVEQAYGRLLTQIAPAASLTLLAAYRILREGPRRRAPVRDPL